MGVSGKVSLPERRRLLAAALAAFDGLEEQLWEAGGAELAELFGEVDAVVRAGEAARVAVVAEAVQRGEPGAGPLAQSPVDWVLAHAPSLRAGGAAQVVRLARSFGVPGTAPVKEAVVSGRLPVRAAAVVVSEAERLRPLLAPGAEPAVLEGLITMAREHGPRGCRSLRSSLLARLRPRRGARPRPGGGPPVRVAVAAARGRAGAGRVPPGPRPGGPGDPGTACGRGGGAGAHLAQGAAVRDGRPRHAAHPASERRVGGTGGLTAAVVRGAGA